MLLHFTKYQGTGNDFVIVDDRQNLFDVNNHKLIEKLCQRRFGIGADGLMLLRSNENYDFEMIYFNADGHQGTMCGNGGRCIVQFAYDSYIIDETTKFIAIDGEHDAEIVDGLVRLKMSNVATYEENTDHYFLDTGSPHYVEYVNDLASFDVFGRGKAVRNNTRFKAEGTNVNFVEEQNEGLFIRTYERGVEDETWACGTGATACALSFALKGAKSPVDVRVLGGRLKVEFSKVGTGFEDIYLTGPAKKVFEGEIETDSILL